MKRQISDLEKVLLYRYFNFGCPKYELDEVREIEINKGLDLYEVVFKTSIVEDLERIKVLLKWLPFVEQVAVCNSYTFGMAKDDSDIDLLLITKKNRVYIARLLGLVCFQILGVRRHGKKIKGRYCLSFWLDEENLDVSKLMIQNDYYMDQWKRKVWWLMSNMELIERWNMENDIACSQSMLSLNKKNVVVWLENIMEGKLGDWIESFVGFIQRLKAHKKYTAKNYPKGVIFDKGIVKCHDEDIRWKIRRFVDLAKKT